MSGSFLEIDYLNFKNRLHRQLVLNKLLKFFSLGLLNNQKSVDKYQLLLNEKKLNLDKYNDLKTRTELLGDFKLTENLEGIRMGENTYSDIAVIGGEDYGIDWDTIRAEILSRDGHQCQESDGYCSGVLHVHHITPLSKGGTNQAHNLITLCVFHHSMKHEHMKRNL